MNLSSAQVLCREPGARPQGLVPKRSQAHSCLTCAMAMPLTYHAENAARTEQTVCGDGVREQQHTWHRVSPDGIRNLPVRKTSVNAVHRGVREKPVAAYALLLRMSTRIGPGTTSQAPG